VIAKAAVPRRIEWAVGTLAVRPGERLLEIGCGRGVAAALVAERLNDGRITAIDRSTTAIAAAAERNAAAIRAGRMDLRTAALEDADFDDESLDKIFAINVNLFWTGPATAALERIRAWLKPGGGRLYLFYEPPDRSRASGVAERVGASLAAAGFAIGRIDAGGVGTTAGDGMPFVCVVGEPR
jgi:cyclopropane fatty-acyl-phospholipid synthase-like methyltransferase